MKRADSLLTPFIKDLGIEDGVRFTEIKRSWHSIFHKPLSYHMSPCILSKGELLLNVDSPVWMQELNFYKEDIIKKLSPYGVKAIRFKLGRISLKIQSEVGSQKSEVKQLADQEHAFIKDTISKIHDQDLKETVKTAMKKAITSGKTKIS